MTVGTVGATLRDRKLSRESTAQGWGGEQFSIW